jgi:hypothetical protein
MRLKLVAVLMALAIRNADAEVQPPTTAVSPMGAA